MIQIGQNPVAPRKLFAEGLAASILGVSIQGRLTKNSVVAYVTTLYVLLVPELNATTKHEDRSEESLQPTA